MNHSITLFLAIIALFFLQCQQEQADSADLAFQSNDYQDLEQLFTDWRSFENPPLYNGAPDYRKITFDQRQPAFLTLQSQLNAIDTSGWPIAQKVDWMIVWAEMNGYDFNYRVLKPWERDPAFYKNVWSYKSDVPAHEGPTNHATTELWTYEFPLSAAEKLRLIEDLGVIKPLYDQAKTNLTGNARELWIAGIRDIRQQADVLTFLATHNDIKDDDELLAAVAGALSATEDLIAWLEQEGESKTGLSGIGKDNYSWYQQNVHLVPLSWEEEVMILKRELARSWTALKLEEHKNRHLPELKPAENPETFDQMANEAVNDLITFLRDEEIVTVADYFEPALDAQKGSFIPESKRNFFTIGLHYDPRPLYSHFYHWFELARMDHDPHASIIRRGPLLYNIFDSRNEGTATAVEEMFMQAGLYEDNPRAKEIVYIMIAQRAARGLGSLYAHANEMTMEEAGSIHSEYTPRGWMKTEQELLIFEQHLYLRQPGYGTSYITGKYLLEETMADYARLQEAKGEKFQLKDFFDQLNAIGNIPITLTNWEMNGINMN